MYAAAANAARKVLCVNDIHQQSTKCTRRQKREGGAIRLARRTATAITSAVALPVQGGRYALRFRRPGCIWRYSGLGWSSDWTPAAAHAHDWLGEAVEMAGKLRVVGDWQA